MATLHHNANPHKSHQFGIIYETPIHHRTSRSHGHDVGLSSNCNEDHMMPANVVEIEVVRAITSSHVQTQTQSPYEFGFWSGEHGVCVTRNPFPKGTAAHTEWLEGWDDFSI